MPESRKNSKPENYRKMPQNPTRQVHALLGVFVVRDSLPEKNLSAIMVILVNQKVYTLCNLDYLKFYQDYCCQNDSRSWDYQGL
jgi:hypothetical protein